MKKLAVIRFENLCGSKSYISLFKHILNEQYKCRVCINGNKNR